MTHGHPDSYDDSILESGNHIAKVGKRILFWGGEGSGTGSKEDGRCTVVQNRATGKRDSDGNLLTKQVEKRANASVEVQVLENTFLRQQFERKRACVRSEVAELTLTLKREGYARASEIVSSAIERLDAGLDSLLS